MGKTVLVTGGAGFIPSHVCKQLLDKGDSVICIDNLSTGDKRNIRPLLDNDRFEFIEDDVRKSEVIDRLGEREIQEIYHSASPASVTYIVDHPVEAATVNSVGTFHLLELAKKKNAKILFASSSEAYGDPKEHPQKESYWGNVNPVGVRSGYDEGKRFGEAICMAYHREFGVDVKIIRIFNTYGPHSSPTDTRVIPAFVVSALQGKPLPVHGEGLQTRSFCYVSDMVDGHIRMMESTETGPLNIGNPDEHTIIDMAKKIIEMTNSSSKISFVPRPQDDPSVRRPDIQKAKEKLSWQPTIPLEEGLTKTIHYFREILS